MELDINKIEQCDVSISHIVVTQKIVAKEATVIEYLSINSPIILHPIRSQVQRRLLAFTNHDVIFNLWKQKVISNSVQNTAAASELQFEVTTPKQIAYLVIAGFDKSFRRFLTITRTAQSRFEKCQWAESVRDNKERINTYEEYLSDIVVEIYQRIHPHAQHDAFWLDTKNAYTKLIANHPQFELAETFYNSVIGRVFKHKKIDNDWIFVTPNSCHLSGQQRYKILNNLNVAGTVEDLFDEIVATYRFNAEYDNLTGDLKSLGKALRDRLSKEQLASVSAVDMLKPVFYRGKAAYLIGRIVMPDTSLPFVIALQMTDDKKIMVDALITERAHMSFIFSFARSYFMVDTEHPAEVVSFLHELLPHKKSFELYMFIGFFKHGKTAFYRDYLEHIQNSQDQFELAPGIKGLVMAVFHLPSYGVVFKIIKDEFAESKKITRQHVKDRYTLVKHIDRIGRMADTHEYINFVFPRERFSQELLDYLLSTCASSAEVLDTTIVIKHLYIERKMTPLNLYFQKEEDPEKIRNAIDDLGRCIKQIASANIFPGDMLHKNFGITKTGRVIFYDYDEICYMNERQFRELPKSDDPFAIDTLSVGPTDVFPEQFEHFIVGKKHLKDLLKELHGDLLTPEYWQKVQATAGKGTMQNFTPYPPNLCFKREYGQETSQ